MKKHQSGAGIVEFALASILFLTFLLGIIDFSRLLFTWSAANEATRAGARYAVVCATTDNSALVLTKMRAMLPEIRSVALEWRPAGCTAATCRGVNVTITGLDYLWISPIAGVARRAPIAMPTFATYLPREIMRQDVNSATICS